MILIQTKPGRVIRSSELRVDPVVTYGPRRNARKARVARMMRRAKHKQNLFSDKER